MGRQGGRADAEGRAVACPVLPHREVEAAMTDEQERRCHAQNPADGGGSRDREGRRWAEGEPVHRGSAGAEQAKKGQRHTVIAGALEELPHSLAGDGAQAGGLKSPERHVEDDRADGLDQGEHADRNVDDADSRHELPRPRLRDSEDREVRQPRGLGDDTEGPVADEARGHRDAKNPVQRRGVRRGDRFVVLDHAVSSGPRGPYGRLGDEPPDGVPPRTTSSQAEGKSSPLARRPCARERGRPRRRCGNGSRHRRESPRSHAPPGKSL